tara:strand:+ start:102 stop:1112 length:1011 start_codon:yes stop_codon:yes gene_type:complete
MKRNITSKKYFLIPISLLPFTFFYIFSYTYSLSSDYALFKLTKFLIGQVVLFIPLFIFKSEDFYNLFKKYYLIIYIIFLIFISYIIYEQNLDLFFRSSEAQIDYLAISFQCIVYMFLFLKENTIFHIILKVFSIVILALLGGRGPIVFLTLLMAFYYLKEYLFKFKLYYFFIFLIVSGFIIYFLNSYAIFDLFILRIESISDDPTGLSNPRFNMWVAGLNGFMDSPLIGNGIGSFGEYYTGLDSRGYPHNLFIEILFESGLIGFLLFSIFMYVLFKFIFVNKSKIELSLLLIYMLLDYMKSGSLEEFRITTIFIGILIATTIISNNNKFEKNISYS